MLFYRAALPLSSRTLNFAAGLIRRHLKAIGSGREGGGGSWTPAGRPC